MIARASTTQSARPSSQPTSRKTTACMPVAFAPARENPRPCRRPRTGSAPRPASWATSGLHPAVGRWRRSVDLGCLADPIAVDAAQRDAHLDLLGDDAEHGLVLLGPGPV